MVNYLVLCRFWVEYVHVERVAAHRQPFAVPAEYQGVDCCELVASSDLLKHLAGFCIKNSDLYAFLWRCGQLGPVLTHFYSTENWLMCLDDSLRQSIEINQQNLSILSSRRRQDQIIGIVTHRNNIVLFIFFKLESLNRMLYLHCKKVNDKHLIV